MLKTIAAVVLLVLAALAVGMALLVRKEGAAAAVFAIVGCMFAGFAVLGFYIKSPVLTWTLCIVAVLGVTAVAFQIVGTVAIVNGMNAQTLRRSSLGETFSVSMQARRVQVDNLYIYLHSIYEEKGRRFFEFDATNMMTDPVIRVTMVSGEPGNMSDSIGGYDIYLENAVGRQATLGRESEAFVRVVVAEDALLTAASFRRIEQFVLEHGDRIFYGNRYNDNPHYAFEGFDVFLDPGFPRALQSELAADEYDELLIRDWSTEDIYFRTRIHRDRTLLEFDLNQQQELERYFEKVLSVVGSHRS